MSDHALHCAASAGIATACVFYGDIGIVLTRRAKVEAVAGPIDKQTGVGR
ncbi:MAG: hypothetical protein WBC90_12310 [Albidovulum sp.]